MLYNCCTNLYIFLHILSVCCHLLFWITILTGAILSLKKVFLFPFLNGDFFSLNFSSNSLRIRHYIFIISTPPPYLLSDLPIPFHTHGTLHTHSFFACWVQFLLPTKPWIFVHPWRVRNLHRIPFLKKNNSSTLSGFSIHYLLC